MQYQDGNVSFYVWKERLFSYAGEWDTEVKFYGRTLCEYAALKFGASVVEELPSFTAGEIKVVLRSSHTCLPKVGVEALIKKAKRLQKNVFFGSGWVIVERSKPEQARFFPLLGGAAFLSPEDYPFVAERIRVEIIKKLLRRGVVIEHAGTAYIDDTATIESGVVLSHDVTIKGKTLIKSGAKILPYTVVEDAEIGAFAEVGPFARLRKNSKIGGYAKIGNFTEVKNAVVGEGSKAAHLSYIGDAEIGKKCNVGCGTVFVNYDGRKKHKTVVGDKCFIGSNSNLVAPVTLGDGSFIAAGSTLTKDLESGDFCVARERERVIKNRAKGYYDP